MKQTNKTTFVPVKTPRKFTKLDAKAAIEHAVRTYGIEFGRIFEQIYRWETAHFRSGQFIRTGTPGMELGKWSGLSPYLGEIVEYSIHTDPKKGPTNFICWNHPLTTFADFFYNFIHTKRAGNFAAWHSLNTDKQNTYRTLISKINPLYANRTLIQ